MTLQRGRLFQVFLGFLQGLNCRFVRLISSRDAGGGRGGRSAIWWQAKHPTRPLNPSECRQTNRLAPAHCAARFSEVLPHSAMQPERCCPEISQNVIRSEKTLLGGIDVNTLSERADIARPNGARRTVVGEIETRFPVSLAG